MSARFPQHLLTSESLPACPVRPGRPPDLTLMVIMVADPRKVDCPGCREVLRQERVCPDCRTVDGHTSACAG